MIIRKIILTSYFILSFAVPSPAVQDIFLATETGDIKTVRTLVEKEPNIINTKNEEGSTPLHIAVLKGHKEIVEYLLSHHPDMEIKNDRKDMAKILISYKGKDNKPDFPILKGPYLGQKPPGKTPEVFAP